MKIRLPTVDRKLLPFKTHFFLYQGGTSPLTPFLTTIAKDRGYSAPLVGIVFSVLPIAAVATRPVFGAITDRFRCRKKMFLFTMAVLILITASYDFIPDSPKNVDGADDVAVLQTYQFWLFFGFLTIRNIATNVNTTLAETMCLQTLGENSHNIGKQKLWGSLGWGLVSMMTGWLIDWYSNGKMIKDYMPGFIVSTIFLTGDLLMAFKITDYQGDVEPKNISRDLKKVLSNIKIGSYTILIIFFGIFYGSTSNYLFWHMEELVTKYHPEKFSSIKSIQGALIAVKCFGSQAPFFFLSGKIIKKVGHLDSITIGLSALSVRFLLYFLIKDPVWLLPVELLSGLGSALPYSAMVSYGSVIAPEGLKGTIQGLFGVVFQGIGVSLGSLITGYLFDKVGSSDTFLVYSICSLVVCFLLTITNRTIANLTKSKTTETNNINIIT